MERGVATPMITEIIIPMAVFVVVIFVFGEICDWLRANGLLLKKKQSRPIRDRQNL